MKLVLDNHIHTLASGHAYSTIKEIVEEAARKGLEAVSITDHGLQMPGTCTRMHFLSLHSLPKEIMGVRIFPGVELDILNERGEVDLEERALKTLTTIMAGIHPHCYEGGSDEINTNAFINVMKNPYVKIIVHPGDPKFPFDIEKVVHQAAKTGTAIEINDKSVDPTSGAREGGLPVLKDIIRECIKQDVYLSFGSDSHFFDDVGDFRHSIKLVDELGIPEKLILNSSVDKYLAFIAQKKNV